MTTNNQAIDILPRHSFKVKVSAFFGSLIMWMILNMLFLSCRKEFFGKDFYEKLRKENNNKVLSPSWHRSIFYTVFFFRDINAAIMASRSKDGEFVSSLLRRFGLYATRGSSGKGKGGQEALSEFVDHVNKGHVGGLALDAPKGPPYISKHGTIYAAARTGAPILPHIWYAIPNTRISSWDRSIVPKPFSRMVMIFDREVMTVPKDAGEEEIEALRKELDQRMLKLTYQADHWFELSDTYSDPRDIPVPDPVPIPYHPERKKKR